MESGINYVSRLISLLMGRFTPESGHLGRGRYTSANDPKRTFAEVRLTLKYRTSERIYYFLNPWSYDYQPNLPRFHI